MNTCAVNNGLKQAVFRIDSYINFAKIKRTPSEKNIDCEGAMGRLVRLSIRVSPGGALLEADMWMRAW